MAKRKLRESTGLPFRTDRELVSQYQISDYKVTNSKSSNVIQKHLALRNEAALELWEKYFLLRMKMRNELATVCARNGMHYPEMYEEYDSEAWDKFINQMNGVRLNELEHIANWSIYIRLWGYWRSMNRDLIKKWLDWHGRNTSDTFTSKDSDSEISRIDLQMADTGKDAHDGYELNMNRDIFWEAMRRLESEMTTKQKKLISMLEVGEKKKDIAAKLKTTNKIIKENQAFLKQQLNSHIKQVAAEKGIDIDYNEMLLYFEGC